MAKTMFPRVNRVPYYQKLYQSQPNVPMYMRSPRSKYMIYPFYFFFYTSAFGSMYMMVRLTLGHKTWFGKD